MDRVIGGVVGLLLFAASWFAARATVRRATRSRNADPRQVENVSYFADAAVLGAGCFVAWLLDDVPAWDGLLGAFLLVAGALATRSRLRRRPS